MNQSLSKWIGASLLLALALSPLACAPLFDPGSEVEGKLRVLAVQKDKTYARPDDDVRMKMLWNDGSGEPSRKIQIAWLAGCYNPRGDNFGLCFSESDISSLPDLSSVDAGVSSDAGSPGIPAVDAGATSDSGVADAGGSDEPPPENAPELSSPFDEITFGDADFPVKIGFGEEFSFHVPETIISSRPPPGDDNVPRYGLAYVFFAVCAGEVRFEPDERFPLACYDGNRRLSSEDFVAGYTAIHAYDDEDITNTNPQIKGFLLDGKPIEHCTGTECSGLIEPASDEPGACGANATIALCGDRADCHKPTIKPIIDQTEPAENDTVLSATRGTDFGEQMWVNYYIDRGEVKSQVRLLNDAKLGWNEDYETQLLATKPGTAYIWAVVHDNRGGTDWVRARVCVTP